MSSAIALYKNCGSVSSCRSLHALALMFPAKLSSHTHPFRERRSHPVGWRAREVASERLRRTQLEVQLHERGAVCRDTHAVSSEGPRPVLIYVPCHSGAGGGEGVWLQILPSVLGPALLGRCTSDHDR
jgi:hypothetical protein